MQHLAMFFYTQHKRWEAGVVFLTPTPLDHSSESQLYGYAILSPPEGFCHLLTPRSLILQRSLHLAHLPLVLGKFSVGLGEIQEITWTLS